MAIRLTQEPVEVSLLPTSASLRMTQQTAEVGALPSDTKGRITQLIVEVSIGENPGWQPFEEDGLMLTADRWF